MKALIDPQVSVTYTSSWVVDSAQECGYRRVNSTLSNSARVCDKKDSQYDVASPLFWVDCADDLDVTNSYYDTSDSTIKAIPNAPVPTPTE
jgi:hypothetical protein